MKQIFILCHPRARQNAIQAVCDAPDGMCVEIKDKTRSLEQNSRLWAMLTDISNQVQWYERKLSPEQWKHVFTAALKAQDVVPNLDGTGFVVLGQSTSSMTVKEMTDLQELITAFGSERNVIWGDHG